MRWTMKFILILVAMSCGVESENSTNSQTEDATTTSDPFYGSESVSRWTQLPIEVYIDENFNEDQIYDILSAIETWNDTAGLNLLDYLGTRKRPEHNTLSEQLSDTTIGIWAMSDWDKFKDNPVILGSADARDASGQSFNNGAKNLTTGDVFLNLQHYNLVDAKDEAANFDYSSGKKYCDTESLALHEIGHLLGLPHTYKVDAVMYPRVLIGPGLYNRDLSDYDVSSIKEKY